MIFAKHYHDLVSRILGDGGYEVNHRTQSGIKLLPGGYSFSINLNDNILPTCGLRRTRPHIAAAETAWCFMGDTSLAWLQKHTKTWNSFADDGRIPQAYGYRWKWAFAVNQIQLAIDRLIKDSTDRRVWISSYHPEDLVDSKQKTVPCPVGFTLSIFEGCLNSTFVIRSSDVIM